ncbi:Choline transporter-like protein 5 [Apodemus speciosus]|uniref:Choline transporter-like protein n=1 Tax=Apodemus speciosus TaxID=105296 RepID=A0ABQ0EMI1_APOSI
MARKRKPPNSQGDPRRYDPDFQGPTAQRRCTDVLCCMIFLLFIMGYVLLGLLEGFAMLGHMVTPGKWPILQTARDNFVARREPPGALLHICVSRCPERFLTYLDMQFLNKKDKNYWEYYSQFCKAKARPVETLAELLSSGDCPLAVYPSRPFLKRCVPDLSGIHGNLTFGNRMQFKDGSGQTRNIGELREAADGLTVAMALSWTFLILLRFTAGFLFWFFIFGVLGIIGYGIWYCFLEYNSLQQRPQAPFWVYGLSIQRRLSMFFHLKETWFSMMIVLSAIEVIIIIVLIFLRTRIRVAIILLKEGSKNVRNEELYGVGWKIFPSTNIPKDCPGASCNFAFYGGRSMYHNYILTFQIYNLFAFLWLINFVIALGQCALAGAFASYYWAMRKPEDIPRYPLFTAFGRAVRYHTGSLAFGSLILASLQMFKVIIEYLDRRLKSELPGLTVDFRDENGMGVPEPCRPVPALLPTVLFLVFGKDGEVFKQKCLHHVIALYGKNFCESTRDAFFLLMRNILKVTVTDEVTYFVLLLGKVLVSGIVGVLAFLLFTERLQLIVEGPTTLNYYWVPFLTLVFGSYLIAHGFFSVYSMCVETIFICFCPCSAVSPCLCPALATNT